jgi:hypothetical protein
MDDLGLTRVRLPESGVVLVTTYGELLAESPSKSVLANAAARTIIKIDDQIVTQSEEVHFNVTTVGLLVNASSATLLKPGKHQLSVSIIDVSGGSTKLTPKALQVDYIVLAATTPLTYSSTPNHGAVSTGAAQSVCRHVELTALRGEHFKPGATRPSAAGSSPGRYTAPQKMALPHFAWNAGHRVV